MSEEAGDGALHWWWVRHAPSASAANIIHGTDNVAADLSDAETLARLANALPTNSFAITSSVVRAVETYDAFRALNPTLPAADTEADFREQEFGAWTGRTWDEIAPEDPSFWADPVDAAPPDGESYAVMCRRVLRRIAALSAHWQEGSVVCVAHAGTIRAALALALDLDFAESIRFEIEPLSLTRIDAFVGSNGISWRVHSVNVPFSAVTE